MNTKIGVLAVVMVVLTALFVQAYAVYGTGVVPVYGDAYMSKYFRPDQVMEINIEIGEADWQDMMENAIDEEFHPASVTVNGDVYPYVKIRTKGNSSLSSVVRSDSDRYSFKINFNGLTKGQTMAGVTQLNLNNNFSDPSYMREYLAYQIFEEMGVATPARAFAAVYVNGEYWGLYLAVESVLEPFLERNFRHLTGDLYKSVGNALTYNGPSKSDYTGLEVKSKRKNADWSKLITMLDVLNNGGDIEKYLDVDGVLRYLAVSTALANFDSYQGIMGHNYYLYEKDGVFTILPWDLNMAFGGFGFNGDATTVYIDEPTQGPVADRPLIAKLLENEEYRETYHGYLEELATKYLSGDYLERETVRIYGLIADYVKDDPTAFYTFEQFEQSIGGTIIGGAMGLENQVDGVDTQLNQDNRMRQGFRMGGVQGFGGNVPGIIELASSMSDSILKQLRGELPSTNDGNGMGGRGMHAVGGPIREDANLPVIKGERILQGAFPDMEGGDWQPPAGMERGEPPAGVGMGEPPSGMDDMMRPMEQGRGQRTGREGMGMPMEGPDWDTVAALGVSFLTIIAAVVLTRFFRRRRFVM